MYSQSDLTEAYKQGYDDGYERGKDVGYAEAVEAVEEYYDDDMR